MKQSSGSACGVMGADVVVTTHLFKLVGSSQPSIVRGSDGRFYVIKCKRFPIDRGLMNEVVGARLIRLMGLPSTDWQMILISDEFIDRNPDLWFHNGNSSIRPTPGFQFGSHLIEAPGECRTYQMIPHSWIERIENRSDFLGMLVTDLWANSCDRRQAVFLADEENHLRATFIDNDHMFGGNLGDDLTCPRRAMVYDTSIYDNLWSPAIVKRWVEQIAEIDDNVVTRLVSEVPNEWASDEMKAGLIDLLAERRRRLKGLLNEAKEVLGSTFAIKYHRTRNATEPSLIRTPPIFTAL